MSKKGKNLPTVKNESLPEQNEVKVEHATILDSASVESSIALPPGVDMGAFQEVISLNPIVQFDNIGNFVMGTWLPPKYGVGKFKSRLYNLRLSEKTVVSVWGSTILDNKVDLAQPKVGDIVGFQLIGSIPSDKGQDAKDFRVVIKRQKEDQNFSETHQDGSEEV